MLFFLCTNDDVVFKPTLKGYSVEIILTDSLSGATITDYVYPGQKIQFSGTIKNGDTSRVTPLWSISQSARYNFYHEFASAGDTQVIFTIKDNAEFTLSDTLIVHVKKIDNALLSGRAFLNGLIDHRNIKVTFRSSDLHETIFITDSSGQYAKNSEIAPGTYTFTAEEISSGYIYNKYSDTTIIYKGKTNLISDIILKWSYSITPENVFLQNDTIIPPHCSLNFPIDITDIYGSKVTKTYSVVLNNSQTPAVLATPVYTFNDCGSYKIAISSRDSANNTEYKDTINVYATWDNRNIIKPGLKTQVIAGSTSLLVNNRNRKTEGIRLFSWDFDGDGKNEKDTSLSSNALYTNTIPGIDTAICKSYLKNGTVVYDSFFINVLPNTVSSLYAYDLKVRDVLTNEIISADQIVFAGKELSFTAEVTRGDISKVKPLWRVGNSGSDIINSFSFQRIFNDTGFVTIVFSITDSTGASCKDTFTLYVSNAIKGGAVRGKALYKDKINHHGIIVRVMSRGIPVSTMHTDVAGFYISADSIPQGTYDIIAHDTSTNSEYIPDTIKNVAISNGLFTTANLVLEDTTRPHFADVTPSDYLFNDTLSLSAQITDLGAGTDQSSFILTVNDTLVNSTAYTLNSSKLQYSSKVNCGNYSIKATVKDSAGNMSETVKWTFSRVDTSALKPLKTGDSIEISINDSLLFFPYDKWLNEKTHTFTVLIDNKVLIDSLSVINAKYVFKTEGYYTIRYLESFQRQELKSGIAHVNVINDAPVVSLPQDTLIDLNTSLTIKSSVIQKYGRIVSYVWKTGDSVIAGATSDFLVTQPESLPGVKSYILTCTDDDNNIASDTMIVSFGKWVVLGNKGFTDIADYQCMTVCNGIPYVAYRTDHALSLYLHCMMFKGNKWVAAGDTIERFVRSFSINSIGSYPVIAYCDVNSINEQVLYTTFNGELWKRDDKLLDTDFSVDILDSNSLHLQISNNEPYISYTSNDDNTGYLIRHHLGNWEMVSDNSFANGNASSVTLQFSNNNPYVSYLHSPENLKNLYIKVLNNNQWNTVGAGYVQDNVFKYSFCMNNDIPYIATISNDNRKLSVKCFINNQWKDIASPYNGTSTYISLHSFRNHLFIAYNVSSEQNRTIVKMLDGENWVNAGYVSDGATQYISMASDSNNLYVVYADGQVDNRTTVMQLK